MKIWIILIKLMMIGALIASTLDKKRYAEVVEITPLGYPKYFFQNLQGIIHATREVEGNIIYIAVCNLETKAVRLTATKYKNTISVEGAFANFTIRDEKDYEFY